MDAFAVWCLICAVGYPVFRYITHRFNDLGDEALRQQGFQVPRRRRQSGQYVPRMRKSRTPGLGGPIEGRFWGQFLP